MSERLTGKALNILAAGSDGLTVSKSWKSFQSDIQPNPLMPCVYRSFFIRGSLLWCYLSQGFLHRAIFTYLNSDQQDFSLPYEKVKLLNTFSYKDGFVRCINVFLDGGDVVSPVYYWLCLPFPAGWFEKREVSILSFGSVPFISPAAILLNFSLFEKLPPLLRFKEGL